MIRTPHTVLVRDLGEIVADPQRGMISLVGDHGGLALITGDVEESHVIRDTIGIETEHGTVHLEPDLEITISEESAVDSEHEYLIEWSINAEGFTPEQAAATIWADVFGRTSTTESDACVFRVTDLGTKVVRTVDLSEHDIRALRA
ncbi:MULTISPECIES: hypothetical protein [unclassified Microbacterium]|uniref:hypothetical protein n=1 Tax=unclassified Microbacterium TaxID=2609290 RepID=UPI0028832291|nr:MULTISPECIES: hypothetical protein [unclassified Microbacterium]